MKLFAIAALGALASAVSLRSYDPATLEEIDSLATDIGIKESEKDQIVSMAKDEGVTEEDVVSVFEALKKKAGELGEGKTEAEYKAAAMAVLRKHGVPKDAAKKIVGFIAGKVAAQGEKPEAKLAQKKRQGEKPEAKLAQKKRQGEKPEAKLAQKKRQGEKPEGEKPQGEKPEGEKPEGEKPEGEKPEEPEWVSFVKAEFKKADTDQSGEVDVAEFTAALGEAGMPQKAIDMIKGMIEADGQESFDVKEALDVTGKLLAHAKKEFDAEPEDVKDYLTEDLDWDKVTQADLDAAVEYYDKEIDCDQSQGGKPQGGKPQGGQPKTA